METDWGSCKDQDGNFPPEHIAAARPTGVCDAWSHGFQATQHAAIMPSPTSGVLQGARTYVEALSQREGLSEEVRRAVTEALAPAVH